MVDIQRAPTLFTNLHSYKLGCGSCGGEIHTLETCIRLPGEGPFLCFVCVGLAADLIVQYVSEL